MTCTTLVAGAWTRPTILARSSSSDGSAASAFTPLTSRIVAPIAPPTISNLRSEEHTSELQSLMRISYAVFCLKKKKTINYQQHTTKPNKHSQPYNESLTTQ